MIRKATLQIVLPAILSFVACNAYLAVNQLRRVQKIAALTLESSAIQAELSAVLKDITDMETGQRGFLLTRNDGYLQPYTDAKDRIGTDFVNLRARLSNRMQSERLQEPQLESFATSKQAEMERSMGLRREAEKAASRSRESRGEAGRVP